ncbi:MAG: HAMP domain-containing histidine kinase [Anaerolineales bacterium]|nr:HAMP domain-containing histidine kinase [Anaerolineales bacterium]MCX7755761.1 HAMP domain-containing histidine kinase [Anaerolineales bacterium]MDW8279019.1 ATP-binding protein [Anaerolineales bacterium]
MNTQPLISPEVLVPRLGEQLVEAGLLTADQLKQALEHQKHSTAAGKPILLGNAIIELGFLDRPTLDRAVTEQILRLRAALEDANRHLEQRVQQRTAELEEALRKLAELNQLKANFVANVSHELRTPLTHIRGYLELLHTQTLGPLTNEQIKAVEVALQSAFRLQNLIEDLILFSLAARGEMTLTLKVIDLRPIVENVSAHARSKAENRQITLETRIAPQVSFVRADQEKIRWVLTHLLDNAIKFTEPGGRVELKIAPFSENPGLVNVSVSDTGIGIPPERLQEIFEPFHQLDGSPTRKHGGTGLGLALVREIVEAHGSRIDVQSEVNRGTTFSFSLLSAKGDEIT